MGCSERCQKPSKTKTPTYIPSLGLSLSLSLSLSLFREVEARGVTPCPGASAPTQMFLLLSGLPLISRHGTLKHTTEHGWTARR